jgi:hypothetical protein
MSRVVDLSCLNCGSNRVRFPDADADPVVCEDCGTAGDPLSVVKERLGEEPADKQHLPPENRAARRERHTSEVEASQEELRENVAETDRLVDASDRMLRRHRRECDENSD